MAEKYDVVGYGALNWDDNRQVSEIVLPGRETSGKVLDGSPGGSAANTIAGLSRLGIDTAFVGAVGNDEIGAELIKDLRDEGIKPLVKVEYGHSGNCLILVDSDGERIIYVFPEVNDTISIDEVPIETIDIIRNAEYLFSATFACQNSYESLMTQLELARAAEKFCFSPGNLYTNPEGMIRIEKGSIVEGMMYETDVLFLNEDEIKMLTGESYIPASKTLMDHYGNMEIIAVTLGERGCLVRTKDEKIEIAPEMSKSIQDTTGVGDAFAAGFMYGLLKGEMPETCGTYGNHVAGRCIEKTGAREGLPYSVN
ncbi:MAG: carbohydrate kinase family protein [archaeon]|nr:carbohydrate kinase family protein [archaeon]